MRRGIALLSIAAIVAGTALATLPGRWMGSEARTPPAAQMHKDVEGAVHAPAAPEHQSGSPQAGQPAPESPSAAGNAAGR